MAFKEKQTLTGLFMRLVKKSPVEKKYIIESGLIRTVITFEGDCVRRINWSYKG